MSRRKNLCRFVFDQTELLEARSLMTVVGLLSTVQAAAASTMTFPELDTKSSAIAVRVDQTQAAADAIKVKAGDTFTLTFPDASKQYTVASNKPASVQVVESATNVKITALSPGFLGLKITSNDGTRQRYVGLYIGDNTTGIVPDAPTGYLPIGQVTSLAATGDAYIQSTNFQADTQPIDYAYIYDQGGANYTDGNLAGLLKQAATYGMVPSVVYYNIQNVNSSGGGTTGVVEGPAAAFQSINNYDKAGQSLYTDYMKAYFAKLKSTLATINATGVPTQMVMEPDFLSYMEGALPAGLPASMVPNAADHTQNTAQVNQIYSSGLLIKGVDPDFPDTLKGFVQAVNYAVAKNAPNVRIGWKTNVWAVADQQNWSLGIMHITDSQTYPWQGKWTGPAATWADGRAFLNTQATGVATFLKNVGTQTWTGDTSKQPFVAIDKYGVDGGYALDPNFLSDTSSTAAFGNLTTFVSGTNSNLANVTDADTQKYFGLNKTEFTAFYNKYNGIYDRTAADVKAVFTTLQNALKADYNMAQWFWNSDQWNNYLYFVKQLSTGLGNAKVMLWQIPQGHINGSASGGDLTNTDANYQDSATSYFFGDTFTPDSGGLATFSANQAGDTALSVSGSKVTWGEHMTLAQNSNVMSLLFGAGLGVSTRGTPTPAGGVNDNNFFTNKASAYLKAHFQQPAVAAGGAGPVTADQATWPALSMSVADGTVSLLGVDQGTSRLKPFAIKLQGLKTYLRDLNNDGVPELIAAGTANGVLKLRAFDINTMKPISGKVADINLPANTQSLEIKVQDYLKANPGKELILQSINANGRLVQRILTLRGRLLKIKTTLTT